MDMLHIEYDRASKLAAVNSICLSEWLIDDALLYTLLEFTLSHIHENAEFSVMLVQFLRLGFYMLHKS